VRGVLRVELEPLPAGESVKGLWLRHLYLLFGLLVELPDYSKGACELRRALIVRSGIEEHGQSFIANAAEVIL
jgi:hypothetical protein